MDPQESAAQEQAGGNGDWSERDAAGELPGADELDRRLREVVRERPVLSVVAAVAAGFVLGRLLSRL